MLGASALILGACGGTADTSDTGSAENTSGEVVVEGDVKLWVDTDHVEVFKGIVAELKKNSLKLRLKWRQEAQLMQRKMSRKIQKQRLTFS